MSKQILDELKNKFSHVFEEPVYPVQRVDDTIDYKHYIRLKDEGADPPKRRLYPLD